MPAGMCSIAFSGGCRLVHSSQIVLSFLIVVVLEDGIYSPFRWLSSQIVLSFLIVIVLEAGMHSPFRWLHATHH